MNAKLISTGSNLGEDIILREFYFLGRDKIINSISLNNEDSILDFHSYKLYISTHIRAHTFKQITNRLFDICSALVKVYNNYVDPVEYLMYLYYEEGLSIRDISNRLESIGVTYPPRSLNVLFTNIFGWELRENSEGTNITLKKNRNKKNLAGINSERSKKIQEDIKGLIDSTINLGEFDINKFDYEEFINLSFEEKIIYILKIYNIANSREEVVYFLSNYQKDRISQRTLAKYVRGLLAYIWENKKIKDRMPTIKSDYISGLINS